MKWGVDGLEIYGEGVVKKDLDNGLDLGAKKE